MRLAIAKPDWRVVGGFERLLQRLVDGLEQRGIEVTMMPVDVLTTPRAPYGVVVRDDIWDEAPEYFRYLSVLEMFRRMEFPAGTDCVISTQPPSFALAYQPHVSIFFHHLRIYYDLSEVYVRGGFVDPDRHAKAEAVVREIDQRHLQDVDAFVVASDEVERRLVSFNGFGSGLRRFSPPPIINGMSAAVGGRGDGPALCVSRHEFPKRVELFVQAMHLASGVRGVVVGTGGRESFARHLDAAFSTGELDPRGVAPEDVWLNRGEGEWHGEIPSGIVDFLGRVDEQELLAQYDAASCVVAPAFREDYGLTALEAMSFGKPVIVCRDGGGLVELVEDGVTGLIVEPDARELAEAIARVAGDAGLREEFGAAARERASSFTWASAVDTVVEAVERTIDA